MFESFFKKSNFGFTDVLGSLGGAFVNNWLTQRGDRMRMDYARELSDRSYNQALDFWNRQNAYNTPKAQMERFKDAGLNPHLIYGQTNMASPVPSADVAKADIKGPHLEGLMAYQNLKNLRSQNDLIQAQKDLAVAQAANTRTITSQLPEQLQIAFGQLDNAIANSHISLINANTSKDRLDLDKRTLESNPKAVLTEFVRSALKDPKGAVKEYLPILSSLFGGDSDSDSDSDTPPQEVARDLDDAVAAMNSLRSASERSRKYRNKHRKE